jgi:16S rRNA (cytosine967-C5)-methyltransferase
LQRVHGGCCVTYKHARCSHGGEATLEDFSVFHRNDDTERLERAGLAGGLAATAIDGRLLATSEAEALLGGDFDAVFLDAPCSGTGTMRRHPEICWALAPEALDPTREESLPALQLDLLRAASSRVRVGGALVYATCSVLRAEDEDVVRAFLASEEGRGFRIAPVDAAPGVACLDESARELVGGRMTCEGLFRSSPRVGGCDGHFCARLVRVDG